MHERKLEGIIFNFCLSWGKFRGILNALTRYSNVSTFQYVDFILKWEGIWAHNCIWKWTCILGKVFLLKSLHLSVYYISWKWITNSIWNPFEISMPPGWKSQMKLGYNSYPANGYTFQGTFVFVEQKKIFKCPKIFSIWKIGSPLP